MVTVVYDKLGHCKHFLVQTCLDFYEQALCMPPCGALNL